MNFFNRKFSSAKPPPMPKGGMFKPGEVRWDKELGEYIMVPHATVCFMLHQAYTPDAELCAQQHARNRATVRAGIDLAVQRGFASAPELIGLLNIRGTDDAALRALSDEMLEHVAPLQWLECVLGKAAQARSQQAGDAA